MEQQTLSVVVSNVASSSGSEVLSASSCAAVVTIASTPPMPSQNHYLDYYPNGMATVYPSLNYYMPPTAYVDSIGTGVLDAHTFSQATHLWNNTVYIAPPETFQGYDYYNMYGVYHYPNVSGTNYVSSSTVSASQQKLATVDGQNTAFVNENARGESEHPQVEANTNATPSNGEMEPLTESLQQLSVNSNFAESCNPNRSHATIPISYTNPATQSHQLSHQSAPNGNSFYPESKYQPGEDLRFTATGSNPNVSFVSSVDPSFHPNRSSHAQPDHATVDTSGRIYATKTPTEFIPIDMAASELNELSKRNSHSQQPPYQRSRNSYSNREYPAYSNYPHNLSSSYQDGASSSQQLYHGVNVFPAIMRRYVSPNMCEGNELATLKLQINRPDYIFTLHNTKLARFFVIKSFNEMDVHRSIKYGVWCSTERGNDRLNRAYQDMSSKGGYVFLCFSVNCSGRFCGVCEMSSVVNMHKQSGIWSEPRWRGEMKVIWRYVKDVPNGEFRHIRLETNENKPVTNSRDCTEILPIEKGFQVLQIMANYASNSSLLDDYLRFESSEMNGQTGTRTNS